MSKPSFFEGVGVALVIAVVASAGLFTFSALFYSALPFSFLIAAVAMGYMSYLLARSGEKTGRVTTVAVWIVITTLGFVFIDSPLVFLLLQLIFIWLIRSLYFHNSVLSAMADLGILAASLMIAAWSWFNTNSVFITTWSFFLTQALFVLIPSQFGVKKNQVCGNSNSEDRFESAFRAAETAVRNLASH